MKKEDTERALEPENGSVRIAPSRVTRITMVALIGLLALLVIGIAPRIWRHQELATAAHTAASSVPSLTIMTPARAPSTTDLVLPGSIQAVQETAIHARANGYLKRRLVDIGDRVQSGQVLAEIDTPELDQQLSQAKATLAQSLSNLQQLRATLQRTQAQLKYNGTTLERWRELNARNLVAQQDVDDRQVLVDSGQADVAAAQANVVAAEANVRANQANVQQLLDLQSFQNVRAPFSGIITVRNVDNGALISSGSSTSNMPLFRMAQIDNLRIYVNVPQTFVAAIAPGLTADLVVREFPQRVFTGQVASTAGALDPESRTLLTEVRMRNDDYVLRPGDVRGPQVSPHSDRPSVYDSLERLDHSDREPARRHARQRQRGSISSRPTRTGLRRYC
jgi:RND family efflux transporter MFP subunit